MSLNRIEEAVEKVAEEKKHEKAKAIGSAAVGGIGGLALADKLKEARRAKFNNKISDTIAGPKYVPTEELRPKIDKLKLKRDDLHVPASLGKKLAKGLRNIPLMGAAGAVTGLAAYKTLKSKE